MQIGDAVELTRELVRIDSRNPSLVPGAPGESAVAALLAQVLRDWGFRVQVMEPRPGRPNIVARIGTPGSGTLMFNGHLDVVGTSGMLHPPFDATVVDNRIFGRGATDMKGGVAAMCAAAVRASRAGLSGEIIVCAVSDEEYRSLGTSALVATGVTADAAIVTEPTRLAIAPSHKGFIWFTITVHGRSAHGSRYDVGIDAIRHAGHVLAELDVLERDELSKREHALLGRASLHASLIEGGTALSVYPDRCVLQLERRTLPGESVAHAEQQLEGVLQRLAERIPGFRADLTTDFSQEPSDVAPDAPIVQSLAACVTDHGDPLRIEGLSAWTDAALLNSAGIPAICYGPGDIALAHADEEYVAIAEVEKATDVLAATARHWLGGR